MATNEYFDTRTLNQPLSGQAPACPVESCKATLQRRQGKRIELWCPDHHIEIHSKSFFYKNPLCNIRFERDYFERNIWKNKLKAETHRFGNENSEDALTWNVFAALVRRRKLSAFLQRLFQVEIDDEPELYLWGLRVNLDDPASPKPFDALRVTRKVFESDITKWHTEPDVIMHVPGRLLILIEAKFTSGNTVAKPSANNVPGEKPKMPDGILKRYGVNELPLGSLLMPLNETPLFSQLYRNMVFAIHMAAQLHVQWALINLTSERSFKGMSDDLTTFTNAVLPPDTRQRFVRYTWEHLFRDHVKGKDDLRELAAYLQFKSANRGRAFDI